MPTNFVQKTANLRFTGFRIFAKLLIFFSLVQISKI